MGRHTKETITELMNQRLIGETLSELSNRIGVKKATLSYWIGKSKKEAQLRCNEGGFEAIAIHDMPKCSNSLILIQRDNTRLEFSAMPSADYVKTLLGW
jgi:hypothetical protein